MSNMPVCLSSEVVDQIIQFIKHDSILSQIYNSKNPLGKGIFNIIEEKCVVVYYPIEDTEEENDAFLLNNVPMKNGEKKSIIFINTFQTEEKQVFAAAHELGHFICVAQYVNEKILNIIDEEGIVNRFAAELLMPCDIFRHFFFEKISKKENVENGISMNDFLEIVVQLMEKFSVPYNAVIIRLVETSIISLKDGTMMVDGNKEISLENIKNIVDAIISNNEYGSLRTSSRKKEIKGLRELLNKAEEKKSVSPVKIERLREKFGIVKNIDGILKEKIRISEG